MGITVTLVGNVKGSSEKPGQELIGQTVACRVAAVCALGLTGELVGATRVLRAGGQLGPRSLLMV